MRLHFVTVPIHGSDAAESELNRFLATHRVIAVGWQLMADGPRSAWAPRTATTTWVFGLPERESGSGDPPLTRPALRPASQGPAKHEQAPVWA